MIHPVEEGPVPGPGAVGAAWAFHLDDGGPGAGQQLPAQRAGPHRGQVGDQQAARRTRRAARCGRLDVFGGRARLAQRRRGDVEQRRPLDDFGGGPAGGPAPQRRPRVAGHVVDLQQCRDGGQVVGAGQGERAVAVAGRQQPGGPAGRHLTGAPQPEQGGPPAQQDRRVGVDAQPGPDGRRHLVRPGQYGGAGEVGGAVGQAGQIGQPATSPVGRGRAHVTHCARGRARGRAHGGARGRAAQNCSASNRQSSTARSGSSGVSLTAYTSDRSPSTPPCSVGRADSMCSSL
ncbi:hypothetical protein PICSAR11_03978 [Mycobacterium avium subsp. paratuberculosis]|nr:hypothetical protein PICSAR11_03978 [Mycobacterium avium subsp. paratuberculosis]CAG7020012.1 hypothetical protein PICSAR164_03743 [Mycobacterium avium subsp. paratuberculosis]